MTLNDYKALRHEDFFLAIIKRDMNWDEAQHVYLTIPNFPEKITAAELLRMAVDEAIKESNEPLTDENRTRIEEEIKATISPNFEKWYPVILVKYGEEYIDLSKMQILEKEYEIIFQISLDEYYRAGEYSFEENEDGPYLNIEMEPFENFIKDYENGMLN